MKKKKPTGKTTDYQPGQPMGVVPGLTAQLRSALLDRFSIKRYPVKIDLPLGGHVFDYGNEDKLTNNQRDQLDALKYHLHSLKKLLPMADVNQCETSMDRELYHTNKQKSNEQEWGEQAVHALSFTLERVNYLTTQRTALERSLAEEKRRNEHLQKRLDQMVETAKEIQTQRDRLIETNRMQYQQIVKGEALNKKLIAEKSKAKKRARR